VVPIGPEDRLVRRCNLAWVSRTPALSPATEAWPSRGICAADEPDVTCAPRRPNHLADPRSVPAGVSQWLLCGSCAHWHLSGVAAEPPRRDRRCLWSRD
jgi:hypothetical protein